MEILVIVGVVVALVVGFVVGRRRPAPAGDLGSVRAELDRLRESVARSHGELHQQLVSTNEQTARLAGVPVGHVKIGIYAASGLLSGLAGIMLVIRSSSGVPLGGMGWELDTIAAIVIGGTNLFGGEGRLLRAMMGVLIYQMIANIMNLSGVDPYYQDIVRAGVIIAAVGYAMFRQRRADRRILSGRHP